jgi:hypothetical protein
MCEDKMFLSRLTSWADDMVGSLPHALQEHLGNHGGATECRPAALEPEGTLVLTRALCRRTRCRDKRGS